MNATTQFSSGDGITTTTNTASDTAGNDDAYNVIEAINGFRIFVTTIGLLGNVIVISTILLVAKLRTKITSWYVLQLAVADTAYIVTLPFKVVEDQRQSWPYSIPMCKAKNTVMYINYYSSIFLLTVMALDRYFAICHGFSEALHKFRTRRAVYLISSTVWIVSILLSIPVMIKTDVKGFKPNCKCQTEFDAPSPEPKTVDEICIDEEMGDNEEIFFDNMTKLEFCRTITSAAQEIAVCSEPLEAASDTGVESTSDTLALGCHVLDATASFKAFILFNFVVMFLVPFGVIAVCYAFIIVYMKKTSGRMDKFARSGATKKDRGHRKVFIMCIMLVVVFTICWLPFHSIQLAKLVGIKGSSQFCQNLEYAVMLLTYLNSAINPFVYFIASRFKGQLQRIRRMSGVHTVLSMISRRSPNESGESGKASDANSRNKSTSSSGVKESEKTSRM